MLLNNNFSNRHFYLLNANLGMLMSTVMVITTVLICYYVPEHFSVVEQITSHIFMLVAATIFKIAYVFRCVMQYQLGQTVG